MKASSAEGLEALQIPSAVTALEATLLMELLKDSLLDSRVTAAIVIRGKLR